MQKSTGPKTDPREGGGRAGGGGGERDLRTNGGARERMNK